MSVQPSLNNSNMVVAEIINEINSTQPVRNYPQNARATPIQPPPAIHRQQQPSPQQMQRPSQPQQQQPSQKRATPFRRPNTQQPKMSKPIPTPPKTSSFLQKQKEKMRNKKVRFKEEVEERIIQEHNSDSESESESESESYDSSTLEEVIHKSKKKVLEKPRFLEKDDVKSSDLTETQGFYTKAITFFTNDTKEPLLVLALVFAISMPVVNRLMTRFLPFLMKYGEGSMFVLGIKALIVAVAFFSVKKLLL